MMVINYIDCLTKIYPTDKLCYLASESFQWLEILENFLFKNIVIVNCDSKRIADRYQNKYDNWVFDTSIVSAKTGSELFYSYNLPDYNGFLNSTSLSFFCPNIEVISTEEKQTISLSSYFKSQKILPNWLISDSLQLLKILEHNDDVLAYIDIIIARVSETKIPKEKTSLEELVIYLKLKGFNYISKKLEKDSMLCYGIFVKDYLSKNQVLEHELHKQKNNNIQEEISKQVKNYISESEKRLKDWVYKCSTSTVRQIEDFSSLQEFFKVGELFSGFYGWSISSDAALFIIKQINQKKYDLVIEFGSGTSTLLFAKLAMLYHEQKIMKDLLPKKIISFEHHIDYYLQTQNLLGINNLSDYVELIHAPLVEWRENNQTFLYYDCRNQLQQIRKNLQKNLSKVLILVDGPPGNTGKNARYPAVPFLFEYLAEYQLDIILDDANRAEEKEIIKKWKDFFYDHKINFSDRMVFNEKGMYFVEVN